jgi:hypothetical protein
LKTWSTACFVGVGGLSDRYLSNDLTDDACFKSSAIVIGVFGVKALDRLDGLSGIGVGVRSRIFSFSSTGSGLIGTKPAA